MKKIASILIASVMIGSMGLSAFAADSTNIIVNDDGNYNGYMLMSATNDKDDSTKYSYTVNDKYRAALLKAINGTTAESDPAYVTNIIDYISNIEDRSIQMQTFADKVFREIELQGLQPDAEIIGKTAKQVQQGYWLIKQTSKPASGDTSSLVMVDTAGNADLTVEVKKSNVDVEKKVKEKNDSTGVESNWQDASDYDIGDIIPFKLTGTISQDYDKYTSYYYAFHDTESKGLDFKEITAVKIDGIKVNDSYYTVEQNPDDKCSFEVIFDNLKNIQAVSKNSVITVEYTSKITEEAEFGSKGNPNEVYIEFSNNPYTHDRGKTVKDKVIVFTYKLNANKVDKDGAALEGAGFTLFKVTPNGEVQIGKEIKGVTEFEFKGIDAGEYILKETTVPDGYTKADDLQFTVESVYDTENQNPQLKELKVLIDGEIVSECLDKVFTAEIETGLISTDVVNLSGVELPSTGGVGTKILYISGGILIAGAAVLLITRKRIAGNL